MINSVDFAKRLEIIMEYYGLTATALAEEMDFNRSTISHLVSGRNKPSLEFVMKVLQRFQEVELNWLVSGKGVFPSTSRNIDYKNEKPKTNDISSLNKEISEELNVPLKSMEENTNGKKIDRIVIFYVDGTFKNYEN